MSDANEMQFTDEERGFMERALALAATRNGLTAPNPTVGCVLAKGGAIVGEGCHVAPGEAHAETVALAAAGEAARGASAFVTLEPCNHSGRTGPCSEALIRAGVASVVYAVADPNPVACGGADRLRAAGVQVRSGLLEADARRMNRGWLHAIATGRPYVIGKTAMTLDGRIATAAGTSKWITGEMARRKAHEFRWIADAILVGAETIVTDDPALTARVGNEVRFPLRVVIDGKGRTTPGALAYARDGRGALLATTRNASSEKLANFRKHGVEIATLNSAESDRIDLHALLELLHERGVNTLMIEGGGRTLGAFFDADLIDELAIFMAPKLLGGGRPAFDGLGIDKLSDSSRFHFDAPAPLGEDFYFHGVRRKGGA